MDKIEIRFEVDEEFIHREIDFPKESFHVVFDLMREFEDFNQLNFKYKGEWMYGATFDSKIKSNQK